MSTALDHTEPAVRGDERATSRSRLPTRATNWVFMLGLGAAAGVLYGLIFGDRPLGPAFFGPSIGGPILAYERGLLFPSVKRWLTASSTPTYVAGAIAIYLVLIFGGNTFAATVLCLAGIIPGELSHALRLPPHEIAYSFTAAGVINFVM